MHDHRIRRAFNLLRDGHSSDAQYLLNEVVLYPAESQHNESLLAARFLLGLAASQPYWGGGSPGAERRIASTIHDEVIQHFTRFLNHPQRDCSLLDDRRGTRMLLSELDGGEDWNRFYDRWAVFPDFGKQAAPYRDDLSLALDRRALAYHLSGRPREAARDLQSALLRSDWGGRTEPLRGVISDYYPSRTNDPRVSHLQGWIGWLLFDAGDYAEAAHYLVACHAAMTPDHERANQTNISEEEAKFRTWYDFVCGGYEVTHTHAFWEIGDWVDGGLTPSQSFSRGPDGFLIRLGLSLIKAGRTSEALQHLESCERISPSWDIPRVVCDAARRRPTETCQVIESILNNFQRDRQR